MLTLPLNGAAWRSRGDFYEAIFHILGAPKWHGRNFNALRDSIETGGINAVEPPYRFVITGRRLMAPEAASIVDDFCDLVRDINNGGVDVQVSCD